MATVSLQVIVKDEIDNVKGMLASAAKFFDEFNITVSDKPTANKLKKWAEGDSRFNIKWRQWNDKFDDARNDNFALSTTDYTFWVDADDFFDFTAIPELMNIATENNLDAIFLPYNYAQDEDGRCVTRHYRERLVRNGAGYTWRGRVHETQISEEKTKTHIVDHPEVIHHTTEERVKASVMRNHKILEKGYEETEDPRYLLYLGMSYGTLEAYEAAVIALTEYLKVGKSVEDVYRALSLISEFSYYLNEPEVAMDYAMKAATLKPEYPMAYWLLAQYEADQKNWEQSLEWVKVSQTKPDPQTLSIWDPSARERAILMGAQAEFMQEHYNAALKYLQMIPQNTNAEALLEGFQEEADAETFFTLLPRMQKYFSSNKSLWQALAPMFQYDQRIQDLRFSVTEPTYWPRNSIVIYCGQGYEEWGPQTLDKGMGGSEEAVVYLTRELANLGWNVTVYGEAEMQENPDGEHYVRWLDWREYDPRDHFNVFVAWRAPVLLDGVNAKVKVVDVHDVLTEHQMSLKPDVNYFVKSEFQKDLYDFIPSEQFTVIGNGIKKSQFHENS